MKDQHDQTRPLAAGRKLKNCRTPRFDLPVSHPPLWRFLLDELLLAATRVHRYRVLSARLMENRMRELDGRHCG